MSQPTPPGSGSTTPTPAVPVPPGPPQGPPPPHQGPPPPPAPDNLTDRLEFAKTTFAVVLDADEHFDQKANRILSAIAFLTAAAAAIFARALQSLTATVPTPPTGTPTILTPTDQVIATAPSILPVVVPFGLFVTLVLLGSLAYLVALGPSFNRAFDKSETKSKLRSRLFFEEITKVSREDWRNAVLTAPIDELRAAYLSDYLNETHYIGQKTRTKILFMAVGSLMFRLALPLLIPLLFTFISTTKLAIASSWLFAVLIAVVFVAAEGRRPYQEGGTTRLYPSAFIAALFIGLLLFVLFILTLYPLIQ